MSMENVIREETEKIVSKYRTTLEAEGIKFDNMYESLLRQGISYGISIAAIALAKTPVDITNPKNETPKTTIKIDPSTLGAVTATATPVEPTPYEPFMNDEWSKPVYMCPKCKTGWMCRNNKTVLTTYPPQYIYKCNLCDHTEYRHN